MFGNLFDDLFGNYKTTRQSQRRPQTAYNYSPQYSRNIDNNNYNGYEDSSELQSERDYNQVYDQQYRQNSTQRHWPEQQQMPARRQINNQQDLLKARQQMEQIQEQLSQMQQGNYHTQYQQQQQPKQQMQPKKQQQTVPNQFQTKQKVQHKDEPISRNIAQDVAARQDRYFKQQQEDQRAKTQMFVDSQNATLGASIGFRTADQTKPAEDDQVRPSDQLSANFLFAVNNGYEVRIPHSMVTGVQVSANRRGILTLSAELSDEYLHQVQAFQRHLTLKFQLPNYYDRSDILARKENGTYVIHIPINNNAVDDEMVIGIA